MEWTSDSQELLGNIPFFVRKRIKKKVEEEAKRRGLKTVTKAVVEALQKKFMTSMEEEVKGFSVETCFGPLGCPNRAVKEDVTAAQLTEVLSKKNLKQFLREKVAASLKMHHEFRVAVSYCPNCCSHPQICDIGLVGASKPEVSDTECSRCGACVTECPDGAVTLDENWQSPEIDFSKCLYCGRCIRVCPTGTLQEAASGYRIIVGGKLGRHPQLARDLHGIYPLEETIEIVDRSVDFYKTHSKRGERLGEVINENGFDVLKREVFKRGRIGGE